MSMCSPDGVLDELETASYEELLKIRDKYLTDIKYFEQHAEEIMEKDVMSPSQDVIYQWNLVFLSGLFRLIHEKFNEKYEEE